LRQAGVQWWIVFSLSGHGALIVFILISLYLFAIFRGVSSNQNVQIEHPLTTAPHYLFFYVTTPFLGGMAGYLGMLGLCNTVAQYSLGVAMGTLAATFLVWVIVDPVTAVLEATLSPTSRRHRAQRVAEARAERERRNQQRTDLLAGILKQEETRKRQWSELLKPQAEKLAGLLTADDIEFEQAERRAADIGADAWRIGGLSCMRQLREMAIEMCQQKDREGTVVDYISVWWDGIGKWQNPSINGAAGS